MCVHERRRKEGGGGKVSIERDDKERSGVCQTKLGGSAAYPAVQGWGRASSVPKVWGGQRVVTWMYQYSKEHRGGGEGPIMPKPT